MASDQVLDPLVAFLQRVPGIRRGIGRGHTNNGLWWVKFEIDIEHRLAWHVVQELGFVLNYISINERLPTVFMPVSPPPYMNGPPSESLSWVIEAKSVDFSPGEAVQWLEGRLPRPVDDESKWTEPAE